MDPAKGHDLAKQSTCTSCEFTEDLSKYLPNESWVSYADIESLQAIIGPLLFIFAQRTAHSSGFHNVHSKASKAR